MQPLSGSCSFDEADDSRPGPAGDTLPGGIVVIVQNTVFGDIDPGIRRILPAREFAADERLKMAVDDTIPDSSTIRPVATGQVGLWLAQTLEPRCQIGVGT